MESWLWFFVAVTTLAVVLQMVILAMMYVQFRQMNQRMTTISTELQDRIDPILARLQVLLDDTQPRLSSIISDAAEIMHIARGQAQKVDRLFTEAVDRLRSQLVRADQILGGALETVEDAGAKIRKTLWGPMQQASAFLKGVKVGIDVFRSRRSEPERTGEHQDEELFI